MRRREIEVRAVRADEAEQLPEVRLRAMEDAPYAFSSWYERELERPVEFWQRLARRSDEGTSGVTFVAVGEDGWNAVAGVFVEEDDDTCGYVWGMWVAPSARRAAIGRRLMASIHGWARSRGLDLLRLSVSSSEQSEPARRLYEAFGFTATGEHEPMASDPSLRADEMTLSLR
jgi:GNAT superfamily N-acetyltransferase